MLNNVGGNGSPYPYASLFQYGRLNPGSSTDPGSASSGQSTDGLGGLLSNSSSTSSTQPQGSSSDVASAFQQFDSSIQSFLVQLQSALGNTTSGQTTTASTGAPTTTATSGTQTAAVDGDGDNDGSPASASSATSGTSASATGQTTGHHHHHHHSEASQAANGTDPSSAVQNDLNNLVSDLSTLLNANGNGTGAAGTTTAANGTTDGTSSTSADANSATGGTAGNTPAQSFASTLAQDLLRALQSYGPGASPTNPTPNPSVIQPSSTVA